uniref:Uncharacterized protein n=1 Tax=Tanacetum cinerariifolium TaxID=118510 RepID=A0A699H1G4_TANCI|nr:hypothetical protein [Tanacetum cinerariifolium]
MRIGGYRLRIVWIDLMSKRDGMLLLALHSETTVYNTVLRCLGVLKLESEGDHVHLAIGKFSGLKSVLMCRWSDVAALRLSPTSPSDAVRKHHKDAILHFTVGSKVKVGHEVKSIWINNGSGEMGLTPEML